MDAALTLSVSVPMSPDNYTLPTPGGIVLQPFPSMDIIIPNSSQSSLASTPVVTPPPLSTTSNVDGRLMILPPPSSRSLPSSASSSPPLSTRSTLSTHSKTGSIISNNASNTNTGSNDALPQTVLILERPGSIDTTVVSPVAATPRRGSSDEASSSSSAPSNGRVDGRLHVLVVDDNAMNQKLVRKTSFSFHPPSPT
jgi:hypothetical protein